MRRLGHSIAVLIISAVLVHATLASPAGAQAPEVAQLDTARTLAKRGVAAYEKGDYATALQAFTEADQLYPTPQYRLYMARSFAGLGKLASASAAYVAAAMIARPNPPSRGFDEAVKLSKDELAELRPRIPVLDLDVEGPADAQVTVDAWVVPPAKRDRVEVDPGDHRVEVTAPGFQPWSQSVAVQEGQTFTVKIHLVPVPPPPVPVPVPEPAPPPPQYAPDAVLPKPPESLSHRRQFGAFVRMDIDPIHPGARVAPGLTYGVIDHLDIGVAALVGIHASGVEPRVTGYFLREAVKPFIDVGVPVFFVQGPNPGLRGSAGVQWDPTRHVGIFAQVGGAYFFNLHAPYVRGALLPAVGVQGRL